MFKEFKTVDEAIVFGELYYSDWLKDFHINGKFYNFHFYSEDIEHCSPQLFNAMYGCDYYKNLKKLKHINGLVIIVVETMD